MRGKKFISIPVLVIAYFLFVNFLVNQNIISTAEKEYKGGGSVTIGFGEAVIIQVTRPYFFGLLRLPVYTTALGDIGWMHEYFFNFLIIFTVLLIALESWQNLKNRRKHSNIKEESKMPRFAKKSRFNVDWIRVVKALAIGFGLGFLMWLFTDDGRAGLGLALLLIYLEYKFK